MNPNDPLLDHIILCIFNLLQKHILTLISKCEKDISIYKDIKTLIFQCVNTRYLELDNPTNIMENTICDCISILIISGITHSWENCIEELIQNAEISNNNKQKLIYICLKAVADCGEIMNFIKEEKEDDNGRDNSNKNDNNDIEEFWDDKLNIEDKKKNEIKDKLMSKSGIIIDFINKVCMDIDKFEKKLKARIIKTIVDLIKFWTQFNLNILKNNNLSNLIMDFIHQSINQENPENILILKHIAELLNKAIGSSQDCRIYELYGKIGDNDSIEQNLKNINDNLNLEEKASIEKWLNFTLDELELYKRINNKNKDILWALAKIFSSILENFIFLFFDLNNQRNVLVFNWLKNLISEKRIISWLFFSTIEIMMNYITEYFRFYSYNDQQKKYFEELLIDILLNIMNNCSYNKLSENDFSQLKKEILFLNCESYWYSDNNIYMNRDEIDFPIDDIDITEYRNHAENAICSIYLTFKTGFNSDEYEIIPFNKIFSLMNINNSNNNMTEKNLIILDTILYALKSILKDKENEYSPVIIKMVNDYLIILLNSSYIQNIRIFIDFLLLINYIPPFLTKNEELFKNIIEKLLLVINNTKINQLLIDSCYVVICSLFQQFSNNRLYRDYFIVFLKRYQILCENYSANKISQFENLIKIMFYCLGINDNDENNNEDNNDNNVINNRNDKEIVPYILEIIKPLLLQNLLGQTRDLSLLKNKIIRSYILFKEIFCLISLCDKNMRAFILNDFISNTIDNLVELNQNLKSSNNSKIFNLFPNDEEIINPFVDFYQSNSLNIVEDCPQLIPKINEVFVALFKLNFNFFKLVEFFECFYKYILINTKENDSNYLGINKYVLDNFLIIIKLSMNYINSQNKIDEETFKKINMLLVAIIEVFPNIYIPEMNSNLFNVIISIIQFIFNLIEFIAKEKKEEIYDKYISNIIKCLSEVLNNNVIKIISNYMQQDQKQELIDKILSKAYKLLDMKQFGSLSMYQLPLLYYQMITFDTNLFISIFSKLLNSAEIFNDKYIKNIVSYLQLYYQSKSNIVNFIGEIIDVLAGKRQLDSLEFYFYRLNTKKS